MLAVLQDGTKLTMQEVEKPVLHQDTDVIIRVTATAPCTSDVHVGYLPPCPPYITGHEFVGVVEEVGTGVKKFKSGDRVSVACFNYCGVCEACRKGITGLCTNGSRFGSGKSFGNLPGGFAEYVRVPLADVNMVRIPDNVSDEQALFVGDMLSTAYYAVTNCRVQPNDTVVIIGGGPVGLCAVNVAKLYSPSKIILVGRRDNRLAAARQLGATDIVDESKENVLERVMELTGGKGADAVIEAVGTPDSMEKACLMAGTGATITMVGFAPPGNIGLPLQAMSFKDVTIRIGMTTLHNTQTIMDLLAAGKLDVSPLVTHVFPFEEFEKAFNIFAKKEDNCIKAILKP